MGLSFVLLGFLGFLDLLGFLGFLDLLGFLDFLDLLGFLDFMGFWILWGLGMLCSFGGLWGGGFGRYSTIC